MRESCCGIPRRGQLYAGDMGRACYQDSGFLVMPERGCVPVG